ncbi:MAG: DUF983 domain-containing protein [Alphaproteobacteria bacterium]|nr:DUF983 domain-containing protein [Alphaproteobacteria bacterium]
MEAGLRRVCPRCGKGKLFKAGLTLEVVETCSDCNLALARNDSGDGPAVFMVFILGALLVPAALLLDALVSPPLWFHAVIWTIAALGICVFSMQPIKAYVVALQFKHRPQTWE